MYVCLCVCVCAIVSAVPAEASRGSLIPAAGVVGSCELPDMGAGSRTLVLCKSSKHP